MLYKNVTFFTRMKICMGIVIGVMLLSRADAQLSGNLLEKAGEKLGVNNDYTIEEIREALSGAYTEAEAAMSEKLDGVFDEPYTSSGAARDRQSVEGTLVDIGDDAGSAGGAGADNS